MLSNKRNATNKAKEPYILSGKIFCGSCGSAMIGHTSCSGRNKTKYSTYNCGKRYRTKQCNSKNISKEFIENITLEEIKNKILNPTSIKSLTKKLIAYYIKMNDSNTNELIELEKHIKEIQFEINNIVDAISKGMFHASFKERMDNLEAEKSKITNYINEMKISMNSSKLNEKLIEQYFIKDIKAINEKSINDLKTIINTYVESVIVYEDKVEINLILSFVHINGGGEPDLIISLSNSRAELYK